MDLQDIVDQVRAELNRLDQAIAALEGTTPRRGRPPKAVTDGNRRVMSAAARKRISAAMKVRWAARKKSGGSLRKPVKTAAKKAARRPQMSPAAKKKLSTLMKARWAARKRQARAV